MTTLMRRTAAFLLAAWPWLAAGGPRAEPAAASSMDGIWRIDELVLDIFDCQKLVCGKIVWIDDAARRPSQCGQTIVWGLKQIEPSQWTGGSIRDPDDGSTYNLSAVYEPDGTLSARIYAGIPLFGKTKILRRIDPHSLAGRC